MVGDDVVLDREAIMNMRHVANRDGCPVHLLDRKVVQCLYGVRAAVQKDVVLPFAHLRGAGRQDQILGVDRVADVARRQPARLQGLWVEVDLDLTDLSAHGQRDGRALNRGQRNAQKIQADNVVGVLGESFAAQTQREARNMGGGITEGGGTRGTRRTERAEATGRRVARLVGLRTR